MSFSVILFDDCAFREHLKPLTSTRPTGNLRVGIFTLDQKWRLIFNTEVSYLTKDYLRVKFPAPVVNNGEVLLIDGSVLPNEGLISELKELKSGEKLMARDGTWIAVRLPVFKKFDAEVLEDAVAVFSVHDHKRILYPEDIFLNNADQIGFDLKYVNIDHVSSSRFSGTSLLGPAIYIEKGAVLNNCVLDSSKGPIYIGKGSVLEAGSIVYGPVSIGAGCRVKSGTVLYMNVSVGENSTICGEINNTVIWGNSAKGHAGYLGCAVVGEGCNLGAGTSNSNLRNDWKNINLYDYAKKDMRDTGLQKCGVVIGDHVMLGIGTKINTGTVIGVGSQIAISDFIPKFVSDFSWFTDTIRDRYIFDRFIAMMIRKALAKQEVFGEEERLILSFIYEAENNTEVN